MGTHWFRVEGSKFRVVFVLPIVNCQLPTANSYILCLESDVHFLCGRCVYLCGRCVKLIAYCQLPTANFLSLLSKIWCLES